MAELDPSHEAVRLIQAFLTSRGIEAYHVGGFLRDSLLGISTRSDVRVITYTSEMTKKEIVKLGRKIDAPLDLVYSCYRKSDDRRMCGSCQSCVRLKTALRENGILDEFSGRFAR